MTSIEDGSTFGETVVAPMLVIVALICSASALISSTHCFDAGRRTYIVVQAIRLSELDMSF